MVKITVILPGKTKHNGLVNPASTVSSIKDDIIKEFNLDGTPDEYLLSLMPNSENNAFGKLQNGDLIFIHTKEDTKGRSFIKS